MKQNVKRIEDFQAVRMLVNWMNENMVNEVRVLQVYSGLGSAFEDEWYELDAILDYQMLISDFTDWIRWTLSEKDHIADHVDKIWENGPEYIDQDYIFDQLKLEQLKRLQEITNDRSRMAKLELEKLEKRREELRNTL